MNRKNDDDTLLEQLLNAKTRTKAFETLVTEYGQQLYWHIRRLLLNHDDANDVLQNTFLKAWNALPTFNGESHILTWITRIAINESLDFLRKQKNRQTLSVDDEQASVAATLVADQYFDGDETQAMLQQAVERLPEMQRTVFLLRYYENMKYNEISKVLNISVGALKADYHIAVKKILEYFRKND